MDKVYEELRLLRYSLLPDEVLAFVEDSHYWNAVLDDEATNDFTLATPPTCAFQVRVSGAKTWFEVTYSILCDKNTSAPAISVKGEDMTRLEQEQWQVTIAERLVEIGDSDYPIYQLISLHLLPLLHESHEAQQPTATTSQSSGSEPGNSLQYHALFTSHHLISPNKRRSLQQWSSSLHISGFAKVGYPGVIYLEGKREDVEEFVENVKAMQWLALRLRFVESLPLLEPDIVAKPERQWLELQKIGEVVQEMKQRGREEYVLDLGIGGVGREANS